MFDINLCPSYYTVMTTINAPDADTRNLGNSGSGMTLNPAARCPLNHAKDR